MLGNWLSRLFERKNRPSKSIQRRAVPRRSPRLQLEALEDRLAPAVGGNLFVNGATLYYQGTTAANVIPVTEPGPNMLTINDVAGTINASASSGFSGSGTSTVTGTIPSTVTSIVINGGGGPDILSTGGALTNTPTKSFSLFSGIINLNNSITAGVGTAGLAAITVSAYTGGVINLAGGVTLSTAGTP